MRLVSIHAMGQAMAFCARLGAAGGCVGPGDAPGTGELSLHLVGSAPSGAIYRLRNATITVQGPSSAVFHTDDHPDQTSLSASVPTGDYLAFVADGWQLERLQGATATPVDATLVSDNPAPFSVLAHQRTTVPLRFRVQGDVVDMTQGYDIVIAIDETRRLESIADAIVATASFDQPRHRAVPVHLRQLVRRPATAPSSRSRSTTNVARGSGNLAAKAERRRWRQGMRRGSGSLPRWDASADGLSASHR